ncbi:hypothetical protein C0J52_14819 [Blattella germanica]|nr:hypothetical protein C0J52_14819 [Blattella germanica]
MSSSGVKFSGVKIVLQSDLRAGTTSGNSWQRIKHRDMFLGTWNVRTLYSSGALEILTRELDRTGLDIVALQEVRWPGEGSQESGKFTLYYGGATKPEFGTGFLVRRSILSAIRDIKFVSDRISYIILKGKRHDFIIVNVYGPTEASDDTIKDEFYEELESVFDRLSRYHMKIVLGDFNAKVGREDIFRPTIGKFSLHEDSNDNGVRLVTFATSKNLIVKSTTFQHKDIHKYTWTSPDGETRNQIDHVLVDKRWHSSIIDIRSVRGLDCNSDHQLVRVKIRERLALTRGTDNKDDSDKFELKNLRNDEVRLEYQIKITNRFETLECSEENVATEEENNINREWESIRDTIKLSASESVGLLKKRQSRKWFDDECADMVNKRKLAKMNWMREPNEQNSEQLCSIRRETTRFLKNKKREYLKEKINDLEINAKNRNIRELYQGIRIERKGFQARTNIIKDENGDMLADAKSILNRWGNYFNQLLNVHGEEENEENNVQTAEVLVEEPSAIEVEIAIEKLKMYKASGIDGIPAELIKSGGEKLREKIHRLLSLIWKQETLPNEWKESVIIPIYKKGDKMDCNNYRGISLLSTSYKILKNILVSRLTPFIDEIIGDHQCAFRRNRSTIDLIFSIRQILEKKWEYNGTVHQLYIDFKKAYDSIKREKLYSILINFGIPKKLVRLIGMCLNGTKSRVRVGKQVSDIFDIHNGLKQGDALSPQLFNFVLEHAIKSLEDKEGVQLNGIHKLLVYADDIVLLGDSDEILKDNMHILRSNTRELGLEVNVNKTKYMVTRRNASCNGNGQLMTNEGNFEEVAEFKYLGALITNRNEIQKEIKHRLNSGNACYYALQRLLSSRLLSKNIKLKIYKTVILPVILYGCETWTLTLREEKRLRVFENKVLRKIFGPKRDEETGEWRRLHNTELKDIYGKPDIIRTIKSRRLRWAGHVARMGDERGVRKILEGKPEGKRPVGRPSMKWENNINHDLREVDYTGDDWKTLAQDRDVWRAYVRTAMNLRVR